MYEPHQPDSWMKASDLKLLEWSSKLNFFWTVFMMAAVEDGGCILNCTWSIFRTLTSKPFVRIWFGQHSTLIFHNFVFLSFSLSFTVPSQNGWVLEYPTCENTHFCCRPYLLLSVVFVTLGIYLNWLILNPMEKSLSGIKFSRSIFNRTINCCCLIS